MPTSGRSLPEGNSPGVNWHDTKHCVDLYNFGDCRVDHQIFIAEHGSWNRSVPIGYRVTRVVLEGNRAVKYEVFASGWLQGDDACGRPFDILIMPDGAMLVSDDRAGVIYRISYSNEK